MRKSSSRAGDTLEFQYEPLMARSVDTTITTLLVFLSVERDGSHRSVLTLSKWRAWTHGGSLRVMPSGTMGAAWGPGGALLAREKAATLIGRRYAAFGER